MLEIYIDPRGEAAIENLEKLLERFPKYAERAVASALKSEGYNLKELMKSAIQRGGPEGSKWPDRQRVVDILTTAKRSRVRVKNYKWGYSTQLEGKKGRLIKQWKKGNSGKYTQWDMVKKIEKGKKRRVKIWLWQQRGEGYDSRPPAFRAMQKLAGGIRYRYDDDLSMMSVGFINKYGPVGSNFAQIIRMQAAGYETTVSRHLQRMAWALGVRTGRLGSRFKVPARPLIEPIFNQEKDRMADRIETTFCAAIIRYIAEGK